MSSFALLEEKIGVLLKRHTAVQAENKKLKKEKEKQDAVLLVLKERLARAEQEQAVACIATALPDKKERAAARKQLDTVIKEIDKILTRLDE